MKSAIRILVFIAVFCASAMSVAQQRPQAAQPQPPAVTDPNAPQLTVDEKIILVTDDIKRQDALEKANEAFQKAIAPINEHQEAAKKVIEDEHPGWTLETGPQGWHLVKKQDDKANQPQPAAPAPKK